MNSPQDTSPGMLLQMAGPIQSWGEHSPFNERDTARFPTRSGIIGLLAGALGLRRGAVPSELTALSLTVRVDRAGLVHRDFHTVGGGLPNAATVNTREGNKRSGHTATLISHRYYLADAVFTACLQGETDVLHRCAAALEAPTWAPYLGRRACPPGPTLTLGLWRRPVHHLLALPLARPVTQDGSQVSIELHSDRPLDGLPAADGVLDGEHAVSEINDEPVSFAASRRRYRSRTHYTRTLQLTARRSPGYGTKYLEAVNDYLAHADEDRLSGGPQ